MAFPSLDDFLLLDNDRYLVDVNIPSTNVPAWLLIRTLTFRTLLQRRVFGSDTLTKSTRLNGADGVIGKFRICQLLCHSALHNWRVLALLRIPQPIVIMGTTQRLHEDNGYFINPLHDHLVDLELPNTLLIEDLFEWRWPFPRRNHKILIQTPWRVLGKLQGKVRTRNIHRKLAETILLRVNTVLEGSPWGALEAGETSRITRYLACEMASMGWRIEKYRRLFLKVGLKLLIKEEAHYGAADSVAAIVAAKQIGAITAEYQHGAISSGHDAYNFGNKCIELSNWKAALPDYLLIWGVWWGPQARVPGRVKTIGFKRANKDSSLSSGSVSSTRIVYFGDGLDTDFSISSTLELSNLLGDRYEVVFRPHPLERESVADMVATGMTDPKIDDYATVDESADNSYAVVGELSTALFESVGRARKVIIWRTAKSVIAFPTSPFVEADSIEGVRNAIQNEAAANVEPEQLFEQNYINRYRGFIRDCGIKL